MEAGQLNQKEKPQLKKQLFGQNSKKRSKKSFWTDSLTILIMKKFVKPKYFTIAAFSY